MTDSEILCAYRMKEAEETLRDAMKMLDNGCSPRSIINRSYYAAFYSVLALFLNCGVTVKTSKHSGVIGTFDVTFVITGRIEKEYSRILHSLFEDRLEFDYKELTHIELEDARSAIAESSKFVDRIKSLVAQAAV